MKFKQLFVVFAFTFCIETKSLKVHVDAQNHKKTKLALVVLGDKEKYFDHVCQTLKKDLEFTSQFDVEVIHQKTVSSKKELKDFKKKGYSIALFINDNTQEKNIEARIYNVRSGKMLKGYKITKTGVMVRGWGHAVANAVLPVLTGAEGCFASKIAYCKEEGSKQSICVADFDGSFEKKLIHINSKAVAPRWNNDQENPFLLYSEYTNLNVCLMSTDLQGNKKVAVNFDGLNMLPTFSQDGEEVVMCLSCDGNTQLYLYGYDHKTKQNEYKQLTYNKGNNISPTLLTNGDVIFCSDFEKGYPQIYHLKRKNGKVTRLSEGSSCFAPTYCAASHKIAYSQMKEGIAQIILYDLETGTQKQITFDNGHKLECSWSPCGNYIAFAFEEGKNKRIAVHSLLTQNRKYLTSTKTRCSYPAWSINYERFPYIA